MPSTGAASRGEPSWVWRAGQDRRLGLITQSTAVANRTVLDLGCGIGMYSRRLAELGGRIVAVEAEWCRALEARQGALDVAAAVGERLPFASETFDVVLLHEVLEHVADDRQTMAEVARVLRPGGRAILFVPNRWWPFETHGVYWRGRYRFGNAPFVNYLPDPLRNRLAPHVRTYTAHNLVSLLEGLPLQIVSHRQVFPGYDKLMAHRPRLGAWIRRLSYTLESTPAQRMALSHFMVVEKLATPASPAGHRLPVLSAQGATDDRPVP